MKIMKINLLSLDDKMAKKAADTPASEPEIAANQTGMNALTFLGLKNLMEDPQLGKELGVMKDDAEGKKDESAKSYVAPFSSNIAFKQGSLIKNSAKVAAGVIAGAAALTSCEKNYFEMPPAENKTEITITITNEQTNKLLEAMLGILAQMLEQQKISQAEYTAYFQQIIAWQSQLSGNVSSISGDVSIIKALLTAMAKDIIDVKNGVQENNAYQQVIITLLQNQGYSQNEAIAILNQAIEWAKAHGDDVLGALQQIIAKLDLVNENLEKLNKANSEYGKYLQLAVKLLGSIDRTGKATYKEVKGVREAVDSMVVQNNIQITALETIIANQEKEQKITAEGMKILIAQGYTQMEIEAMGFARANYLLKQILDSQKATEAKLQAILNSIANGDLEGAYKALMDLLQEIKNDLDVLVVKADSMLNKMDNLANILKLYGDQILAKMDAQQTTLDGIKANGDSTNILLKLQNMDIAELLKEVKLIKPELVKLNESANTANTYLNLIEKRIPEFKAQIDSLIAIAGKSLTKDELEELWIKHDADNYAKYAEFLNALHAEDIEKADTIIALMKQGNATNQHIYNLVLDFANRNNLNAEQLRDLLEAIYKYLPELVCKCQCQGDCNNNNNHEGIIGDLLD